MTFDPQAIFLRKVGREVECPLSFFFRLIKMPTVVPGLRESGMSQSIIGVSGHGLLKQC